MSHVRTQYCLTATLLAVIEFVVGLAAVYLIPLW